MLTIFGKLIPGPRFFWSVFDCFPGLRLFGAFGGCFKAAFFCCFGGFVVGVIVGLLSRQRQNRGVGGEGGGEAPPTT